MYSRHRPRRAAGTTVTATDAVRRFSRLIDQVRETGTTYVIESHGEPVAEIVPVVRRVTLAEFQAFLARGLRAPHELLGAIEAESRSTRASRAPRPARLSGRGGQPRRT
jgi:prevent-host-death family protein